MSNEKLLSFLGWGNARKSREIFPTFVKAGKRQGKIFPFQFSLFNKVELLFITVSYLDEISALYTFSKCPRLLWIFHCDLVSNCEVFNYQNFINRKIL